jgi:hypothetical protein
VSARRPIRSRGSEWLRSTWVDLLAHGALILLVLLSFSAALAELDRMLVGHDMGQSYNWESFNRWALGQGQLPLWNPYMFSGFPSLADLQTELFYPPAIALRWLPVPAYFTMLTAFHMAVAGVGTFGICRYLGAGRLAALAGATGFMLGGVFAPKIDGGFLPLIGVWAWFPLGIWLAMLMTRSQSPLPGIGLSFVLRVSFSPASHNRRCTRLAQRHCISWWPRFPYGERRA